MADPTTDAALKRPPRAQAIEDGVLRLVFALLLSGTIVVLGADAWPGLEAARKAIPGLGGEPETDPHSIPMPPPMPGDQVRRYSPSGVPELPEDGPAALPGYVRAPGAEALVGTMTFHRGTDGRASAVGRIDPGMAKTFDDFLESQGDELTTLVLHSPGGSVRDAIAMARAIRDKGLATEVPENGYCASSCPLVFAGGAGRTIGDPAWLGVHQAFAATDEDGTIADGMANGQAISAEVLDLLVEMNVDPAAWIPAMRTPADALYVFTREELTEFRWVATEEEIAAEEASQETAVESQ
ncbi:hypothetical protein [Amorphus sp. 3PC139-8]|uniref:COG3904 family protein n=1 Tax=Amorphus sp. 3PC139-8 TaxID=2735676 RepID=UPI00345DD0FC